MSLHTQTCVWVLCDDPRCGQDKGWPDEGPYHFDTETAALDYVLGDAGMGWTRRPDGRLMCPSCSAKADCTVTGHQWTTWRTHDSQPSIQWRSCYHCGGFEKRFIAIGGQP